LVALALLLAGFSATALAAKHHRHAAIPALRMIGHSRALGRAQIRMPASPTDPDKDAALIVDGATGKVIYARNELAERHPASLTKMMTLYLLFDALKAGKVTMQTQMPVSYHASIQKPTKLALRPGQTIDVDTAIRAIVIRSANDVAVVIAEALGGTESHFAEMMTARARQIGMRETNYHNASGLPDPLQISTASDLAVLGRHLAYDYPQYFPYFGLAGFNYKGAWYPTHDNLIGRYDGADGIKTGYTGASGFNLVSSVTRGTTHLIAVVMGGRTAIRRDLEMVRLLDQTFAQVSANPSLVARANVPWRQVAQNAPSPAIAGFSLPQVSSNQFAALSPVPGTMQSEDEDAAESVRAPDENFSLIHAEGKPAPAPKPAAPVAAAPQPAVPAVPPLVAKNVTHPGPRPDTTLAAAQSDLVKTNLVKTAAPIAAQVNAPRPQMRPSLDGGEGDVDVTPGRNRIIAPITSARGHTLYRARFGLFAEQEAREVCNRLTQRGQTCFAAVQTR
jgi:D-alanyl-D-alanine carboxypeptidase